MTFVCDCLMINSIIHCFAQTLFASISIPLLICRFDCSEQYFLQGSTQFSPSSRLPGPCPRCSLYIVRLVFCAPHIAPNSSMLGRTCAYFSCCLYLIDPLSAMVHLSVSIFPCHPQVEVGQLEAHGGFFLSSATFSPGGQSHRQCPSPECMCEPSDFYLRFIWRLLI